MLLAIVAADVLTSRSEPVQSLQLLLAACLWGDVVCGSSQLGSALLLMVLFLDRQVLGAAKVCDLQVP